MVWANGFKNYLCPQWSGKLNQIESMPPNKPRGFLYRFDSWGEPFWQVAHAVTFAYPENPTEDDQSRIVAFLKLFPHLLPCSICGAHFVEMLGNNPPTRDVLKSTETLSRWLVDRHNEVNVRLNKSELDYADVRRFYLENDTRAIPRCKRFTSHHHQPRRAANIVLCVCVGLLLIVVVALLCAHYKVFVKGTNTKR